MNVCSSSLAFVLALVASTPVNAAAANAESPPARPDKVEVTSSHIRYIDASAQAAILAVTVERAAPIAGAHLPTT